MSRIEMSGRRFHRLTVLSADPDRKWHWLCICDCGVQKSISGDPLRRNLVKSCGCLRRETDHPTVGEKFGYWTIAGESFKKGAIWFISCQCVCGVKRDVKISALRDATSRSCGCHSSDLITKHGESGVNRTPEFATWNAIKNRCYNEKDKSFPDYGGRGIKVFAGWLTSYASFLAYMGRRPSTEHSIERINNNGDYEPGNVKWATHVEQCNNKRSSRFLDFNGKRQTVALWAREIGVHQSIILARLKKGWSNEQSLTTPVLPHHRFVEFKGARRTLSDWARVLGLPYKALHTRIQTSGWPIEKAFTEPLRRRAAR